MACVALANYFTQSHYMEWSDGCCEDKQWRSNIWTERSEKPISMVIVCRKMQYNVFLWYIIYEQHQVSEITQKLYWKSHIGPDYTYLTGYWAVLNHNIIYEQFLYKISQNGIQDAKWPKRLEE